MTADQLEMIRQRADDKCSACADRRKLLAHIDELELIIAGQRGFKEAFERTVKERDEARGLAERMWLNFNETTGGIWSEAGRVLHRWSVERKENDDGSA